MPRRDPDYQRIYADIREKIVSGEYPPRSKLPTIRELQAAFGCSEQPVRAALKMLSDGGWIETQQGKGSFVVASPPIGG
jgi:DNA-binding GntR family transcriptional regulator